MWRTGPIIIPIWRWGTTGHKSDSARTTSAGCRRATLSARRGWTVRVTERRSDKATKGWKNKGMGKRQSDEGHCGLPHSLRRSVAVSLRRFLRHQTFTSKLLLVLLFSLLSGNALSGSTVAPMLYVPVA